MKLPQLNPEEVVGARRFEASTSWSRTRESKILKPCGCHTYDPPSSQNLPSVGPLGTQTDGLPARTLLVGVETHRDTSCFDTEDFAFPQVRSKVVE